MRASKEKSGDPHIKEGVNTMTLIEKRHAAVAALKEAQAQVENIDDLIYREVKDRVKQIGSTTLEFENATVVVTIPKTVKWDQPILRSIADKIKGSGDDPEQYIEFKLNVKEASFKAWPEAIKTIFQPARTVTPGKRRIEVKA